jgi:hypothetical protein
MLANFLGIDLEDVIFIVLGLILIAAAVFEFKDVQQGVRTITRTATKAAKAAAEASA